MVADWSELLKADQMHPDGPRFHPRRTGTDIKDKARNIKMRKMK
jgi:hypothetical protein